MATNTSHLVEDLHIMGDELHAVAGEMGRSQPSWSAIADALRTQTLLLEEITTAAVLRMREQGQTWQDVGDALGVTRSAAQQKYGK